MKNGWGNDFYVSIKIRSVQAAKYERHSEFKLVDTVTQRKKQKKRKFIKRIEPRCPSSQHF